MINSRDIEVLATPVKTRVKLFIAACKEQEIDLLVTSTYRDYESQKALYAQGRTTPGKIVTNADAGHSFHNFKCAVDVVPVVNGKPVWDDEEMWTKIGAIGKSVGLDWAGDWKSFQERAHFQYTGGLSLKDLQEGKEVNVG
jgi:peptidoglycan L-alanyl-D-glutamate endopeptidase CwlK